MPQGYSFARANCVAIQGNKIIVGGVASDSASSYFYTARILKNGGIDSTFGTNGFSFAVVDTNLVLYKGISDLTVLPSGKIVACGDIKKPGQDFDIAIMLFNTDGGLDNAFGTNGLTVTDFDGRKDYIAKLRVQADGKIVVAGYSESNGNEDICIVRYTADGELDNTFNGTGKIITDLSFNNGDDLIRDFEIFDGKIIAVGSLYSSNTYSKGFIIRYNADGSLDQSFANNGMYVEDVQEFSQFSSLAMLPNGKFVVQQQGQRFRKHLANGNIDNAFGEKIITGNYYGEFSGILIRPDEKYICYGPVYIGDFNPDRDVQISRLNMFGNMDVQFDNDNGNVVIDIDNQNESVGECILDSDLRLVIVGASGGKISVVRLLTGLTVGLIEFSPTGTAPLLYPNPLQQTETLKYTLAEAEQISISLIDSQGKLVTTFVENENQGVGEHEQILTLPPTLSPGTYFIQIASPRGKVSIKVVK